MLVSEKGSLFQESECDVSFKKKYQNACRERVGKYTPKSMLVAVSEGDSMIVHSFYY